MSQTENGLTAKALPTAALTGAITRGGLSNWVLFFRISDLVAVDVGMSPAIHAGIEAGVRGRSDGITYGPVRQVDETNDDEWLFRLQNTAKQIVRHDYAELRTITYRRCLSANELIVEPRTGPSTTFGLMNRRASEATCEHLQARFVSGFHVAQSRPHAFVCKFAPFLAQ